MAMLQICIAWPLFVSMLMYKYHCKAHKGSVCDISCCIPTITVWQCLHIYIAWLLIDSMLMYVNIIEKTCNGSVCRYIMLYTNHGSMSMPSYLPSLIATWFSINICTYHWK